VQVRRFGEFRLEDPETLEFGNFPRFAARRWNA
jgi:hypothetical protein